MRRRFKSFLGVIGFLIVCFIALGILYILYQSILANKGDIVLSGPLSINYENGKKLKVKGNKETKISIINDSDETVYYYVEFKNVKNAYDAEYSLSNNKNVDINEKLNNYNTIVSSYIAIESGESQNYLLKLSSPSKEKFSLEVNISVENMESDTFADVILKNNEVKENSLTNVGKEIATSSEGLIKSTDDYGTTYYFRGKVENNYVLLNNLLFRIVRINGDGSVKLVLNGDTGELQKYYSDINNYAFASSNISAYLSSWLSSKLSKYSVYISNQKYCNDIGDIDGSLYAFNRIKKDNIPSFMCLGVKTSVKVALLTVDEVIYAGATLESENKDFYLYNSNITEDVYTMTGAVKSSSAFNPFVLNSQGKVLTSTSGENYHAVRPVITIIKTATVTGKGTVNDPYMLTQ